MQISRHWPCPLQTYYHREMLGFDDYILYLKMGPFKFHAHKKAVSAHEEALRRIKQDMYDLAMPKLMARRDDDHIIDSLRYGT